MSLNFTSLLHSLELLTLKKIKIVELCGRTHQLNPLGIDTSSGHDPLNIKLI